MLTKNSILATAGLMVIAGTATASYNPSCSNNVVTYWGQNSWGGGHLNDPANWERDLVEYCKDDTFDIINISFVTNYNLTGLPVLNHAFHCETLFNGTKTLNCPKIGEDIKTCQANGKKIVLSLGGGGIYSYSLGTASEGVTFANTVWDMFLEGTHKYRPYGDAVLDGVDLDIESGAHEGYPAFINQLRSKFGGSSKQYIISAAPQCVFPDANLGSTLSSAWVDNDYVQFYNNPCNLANIDNQWNFDYASWDKLTKSNPNPNSRMYVGLPAGQGAAGNGYLETSTLKANLNRLYTEFPDTFGGIMLWDASWYSNNMQYVKDISAWVKSNMKCGSVPPTETNEPTSEEPTSEHPTSEEPTSEHPTSEEPTSEEPTSEHPTSDEPISTPPTPTESDTTEDQPTPTESAPQPAECNSSNNGNYMCASSGSSSKYSICHNGSWIQGSCPSGTICIQSETTVYCGWA